MPVGRVFDARQGQVLFSPVSNYYKGEAMRAGLKAQEKGLELEERRVGVMEGNASTARQKFEHEVGQDAAQGFAKDLYARIYAIDEAVTAGELNEEGALARAGESFAEYAKALPPEHAAGIMQKLEGGITVDEYRQIKATTAGALEDYGLLDSGDANSQRVGFLGPDGAAYQGSYVPGTDGRSGQYFDGDGNLIKGATPIAPAATQGDLGFGGGVGDKTADRNTREVVGGAENLISSVDRISKQVEKMPQASMGLPGSVSSIVDNAVNAVIGFSEIFPNSTAQIGDRTVAESELLDVRLYQDMFAGPAAGNAALQANAVGLAYALARAANPDGRISDADVRHQLKRVKLDASSKDQIQSALHETRREILVNVSNHLRVGGYTRTEEGKTAYDKYMTMIDEMDGLDSTGAATSEIALESKYPGFSELPPEDQQAIRDAEK